MSFISNEILNIDRGESIFQKEDYKNTVRSVTFRSIDPSIENINAAIFAQDRVLLKDEVNSLFLEMKFVYAEKIMRDAQEFIKILDSETPDFELIRMKFISLCIQGKNLKSTIAQYCEMKCDTDIIDRIIHSYPEKYKNEKEITNNSNIRSEDVGQRSIIQMEKGGKGSEGCGCSICSIF